MATDASVMRLAVLTALVVAVTAQATSTVAPVSGLQCYQFTWVKGSNFTSCDDISKSVWKNNPCYQPIILTVPLTSSPNITDLNKQCSVKSCPSFTCTKKSQCLRWAITDVRGREEYISVFCGTMVDTTDDQSELQYHITYSQTNKTQTTVVSTCSSTLCNSGTTAAVPVLLMAVSFLTLSFVVHGS